MCAYFSTEEGSVGTNVINPCRACWIFEYDYYTKGPCKEESNSAEEEMILVEEEWIELNGATKCEYPEEAYERRLWNIDCSVDINPVEPVCGYMDNGIRRSYPNPCEACFVGITVDYYFRGECV